MTETTIKPNIYLNIQPTQQFSTIRIEFNFSAEMDADTTADRTLAAKMLENASAEYQSQPQIARALSELYGADFGIDVLKVGRLHVVKAHMAVIDPHFIDDDQPILDQALAFMKTMLYQPLGNATQGFDATIFNRQRELLLDEVAGLEDDRPYIANRHALQTYFDETAQGLPAYGTALAIEDANEQSAWRAWENMVQTNRVDIIISGDVTPDDVTPALMDLPTPQMPTAIQPFYHQPVQPNVKHVVEQQPVNQSQLVMVYQLVIPEERRFAAYVFDQIFGGTPVSRLFLDVRETKGLAYGISTDYNRFTDVLLVTAGIAGTQITETQTAVAANLARLQQAPISEIELNTIKELMKTEYMVSLDNQSQVTDRAFIATMTQLSQAEWFAALDAVTIADVQAVANAVIEQVNFVLEGAGDDADK
ncbi:insulinase family protein [Weissella viridescens]|uniref:Insulinase family protein n=1 Tax=Weissella viridescens TaxID=1629 RepID=A0A3P2RGI6_WEIVI|nr:pitrilysin family protein [Weissella viridescens]RRG17910.1 insulinase family protein [Weissella viridescens]